MELKRAKTRTCPTGGSYVVGGLVRHACGAEQRGVPAAYIARLRRERRISLA